MFKKLRKEKRFETLAKLKTFLTVMLIPGTYFLINTAGFAVNSLGRFHPDAYFSFTSLIYGIGVAAVIFIGIVIIICLAFFISWVRFLYERNLTDELESERERQKTGGQDS